ncbi:hypothetical protein [Streptomyces chattanoogensis]|uniref:hypothetical protein n=1 Tax=Streptomyces chattanoogensis TaxID=66876 RepID=UPI00369922D5
MMGILVGPGAVSAHAAANCSGNQHLHFQPGLKLQPVDPPNSQLPKVKVSTDGGTYSCPLPLGESMTVTSISINVFASCVTSRDPDGTIVLNWPQAQAQGDKTSTIKVASFGISNGPSSGSKLIIIGGDVQSGRFTGQKATIQVTATASDTTKCQTPQGLEDLTGVATAVLT